MNSDLVRHGGNSIIRTDVRCALSLKIFHFWNHTSDSLDQSALHGPVLDLQYRSFDLQNRTVESYNRMFSLYNRAFSPSSIHSKSPITWAEHSVWEIKWLGLCKPQNFGPYYRTFFSPCKHGSTSLFSTLFLWLMFSASVSNALETIKLRRDGLEEWNASTKPFGVLQKNSILIIQYAEKSPNFYGVTTYHQGIGAVKTKTPSNVRVCNTDIHWARIVVSMNWNQSYCGAPVNLSTTVDVSPVD